MMIQNAVLAVPLGYVLGSLPFAVIISRFMGLSDPRSYGSHNPGATNVLRSGNKLAALLTLLGDAAKGALAVWIATRWGTADAFIIALTGLAAFFGHLFPVFLGFKGGKGVSTAAGVLLAWQPLLGLGVLAVWLIVALATRYSSLAAILAALFAPLVAWSVASPPVAIASGVMAAMIVWRHKGNLQRLLAGTEGKIGGSKNRPA